MIYFPRWESNRGSWRDQCHCDTDAIARLTQQYRLMRERLTDTRCKKLTDAGMKDWLSESKKSQKCPKNAPKVKSKIPLNSKMASLSFPAITDVCSLFKMSAAAQVKLLSRNPHVGTCAYFLYVLRHIPPYYYFLLILWRILT